VLAVKMFITKPMSTTDPEVPPVTDLASVDAFGPPNYRRAFWGSRLHAFLALLTLGGGFLTGEPIGIVVGVTLYILGIIFLPDLAFFRCTIDQRNEMIRRTVEAARLKASEEQRQRVVESLSDDRHVGYEELVGICHEIEASLHPGGAGDASQLARRQRLEEIAWTYARLLAVEQTLDAYLQTELREQVPAQRAALEIETERLLAEIAGRNGSPTRPAGLDVKERLLGSRLARLNALEQRQRNIEQAMGQHDYLRSEQEGLVDKVKLIRAEAVAARNTDAITGRLDGSIEELNALNRWLSEISEFEDLTGRTPSLSMPPGRALPPAGGS
jgi:hypothetical protein